MLAMTTIFPPRARNLSRRPHRQRASGKSPWPVAWTLGWPSSPKKNLGVARGVREARRDELLEGGEVVVVEAVAEGGADRPLGGLARHEPERDFVAADALEVGVLGEAQIEERAARERLDQRFDDAAHARGHAAREDAEGDLPALKRLEPERFEARVLGRPRDRRVDDVARRGRLDRAREAIARLGPGAEIARPGAEPLGVEPAGAEALEELGRERGELMF